MNRALLISVSISTVLGLAVGPAAAESSKPDALAYRQEIEDWHRRRIEALTSETGWLTLIGLYWLEPGIHTVGSAPGSAILLPADRAPAKVAELTLLDGRIEVRAAPGSGLTLASEPVLTATLLPDTSGEPTYMDLGELQFFVIERGGRFGVRVRDRAHPARTTFPGIDRFPVDRRWRIQARLERLDPPATIPIPNVLGTVLQLPSPGRVVFTLDGREFAIDALEGPDERLYLIFADSTSGRETYGGGRFLYSEPVSAGDEVVIDFNKAHNPPCAFTDFATCPLPPRHNKLDTRVEAGEKSCGHH